MQTERKDAEKDQGKTNDRKPDITSGNREDHPYYVFNFLTNPPSMLRNFSRHGKTTCQHDVEQLTTPSIAAIPRRKWIKTRSRYRYPLCYCEFLSQKTFTSVPDISSPVYLSSSPQSTVRTSWPRLMPTVASFIKRFE